MMLKDRIKQSYILSSRTNPNASGPTSKTEAYRNIIPYNTTTMPLPNTTKRDMILTIDTLTVGADSWI